MMRNFALSTVFRSSSGLPSHVLKVSKQQIIQCGPEANKIENHNRTNFIVWIMTDYINKYIMWSPPFKSRTALSEIFMLNYNAWKPPKNDLKNKEEQCTNVPVAIRVVDALSGHVF